MHVRQLAATLLAAAGLSSAAWAEITVPMHAVDEKGTSQSLGTVAISETQYGLVFTPDLKGLAPGVHGFHVHEKGDCGPSEKDGKVTPAGAAGGHYDPQKTGKHGAPWGEGHLGDLPALYVNKDGEASNGVLSPRLRKLDEVRGRSLMVHAGGDNYSDHPQPLGGGGARMACGVIE